MIQKELAVLLSRKLSGEATLEELAALDEWIKQHPEDQFFIEMVQAYWSGPLSSPFNEKISDQQFQSVLEKSAIEKKSVTQTKTRMPILKFFFSKQAAVAAFLGFLFFGLWWVWQKQRVQGKQAELQEVFAARGTKSHLVLPDGSEVWLNSDSHIFYDKQFKSTIREVSLNGEAFFKVKKDATRPFVVHTSAIDVKVLGTSFNVKAYENDKIIETTLINGSVEINEKHAPTTTRIVLKPKEKLVFSKSASSQKAGSKNPKDELISPVFEVKTLPAGIADSAVGETSWVQNRLVFEGDSFEELAIKMERWFDVKMAFKNQKVMQYRLRGAFENETIEQALKGLQLIAPFDYRIQGQQIEIY